LQSDKALQGQRHDQKDNEQLKKSHKIITRNGASLTFVSIDKSVWVLGKSVNIKAASIPIPLPHQSFCVIRMTSSMVVIPIFVFSHPSMRRVLIPFRIASFFIRTADSPLMIICRMRASMTMIS